MNFLLSEAKSKYTYRDGELISNKTGRPITAVKDNHGTKYRVIKINGSMAMVHRVIYALHYGIIKDNEIIMHKDGNSLNNCIDNLDKRNG